MTTRAFGILAITSARKKLWEDCCERSLEHWQTSADDAYISFDSRPDGGRKASIGHVGSFRSSVERNHAKN